MAAATPAATLSAVGARRAQTLNSWKGLIVRSSNLVDG